MNYPESKSVIEKIKIAENILLNCHRGPDPDSVGSALALFSVLQKMGKTVSVVCPDEIREEFSFIPNYSKVTKVDFSVYNFSQHDLFITLDSSNWEMVLGDKNIKPPTIETVVIDHHKTNPMYGIVNIVDPSVTSTGELLYLVLTDWKALIDKEIATCLLAAIIGDTGAFRYPGSTPRTFQIASDLIAKGANKDEIVYNIFQNYDINLVKFWGEVLQRLQIETEHKFIWSVIPFDIYEKYGKPPDGKETAASFFAQGIAGTDFGFIGVEVEKGNLSVSLRSRTGVDISKIAVELGGGGHVVAAGAKVLLPFDEAVEKVLSAAKKFSKNYQQALRQ